MLETLRNAFKIKDIRKKDYFYIFDVNRHQNRKLSSDSWC